MDLQLGDHRPKYSLQSPFLLARVSEIHVFIRNLDQVIVLKVS